MADAAASVKLLCELAAKRGLPVDMHCMDNHDVSKRIPLINITLQGRHDSYPKRRGMARVPERMAAGLTVAFGHDCVMDPWYSLGSGDMLEVACMGLHVAQMTSQTGMRQCLDAVTLNAAKVRGLEGDGIEAGSDASLVLRRTRDPVGAIRLCATRLTMWRKGKLLAQTAPVPAQLSLPGRPGSTAFMPLR